MGWKELSEFYLCKHMNMQNPGALIDIHYNRSIKMICISIYFGLQSTDRDSG